MNFRDKYGRYALVALIVVFGVAICLQLISFLGGLLGAATIYVLLRGQMFRLTERHGWGRSWAATVLLLEAVFCFLIPLSLIIWMIIAQIEHITLQPAALVASLHDFTQAIFEHTGYDVLQEKNITTVVGVIPKVGQWLLARISGFVINIVVLLFVLFFMLVGGRKMERYCRELLPFEDTEGTRFVHEVHQIVRSNAIGIPLLALIQGIIAYIGYLIFGVPMPLFWAALTCFASIIPLVGTAVVWLPLAIYMGVTGSWGIAIGLAVYCGVVLSNADNALRFVMQKRMADIHPLITVFGVIIGLSLFGFMGVIFGPLLLAIFIFCFDIFKKKYIDGLSDDKLFCARPASSKTPRRVFKKKK